MPKPIMLMNGGFSNRIWAVRRYRDMGEGRFVVVGDNKDDVTEQAIAVVAEHRLRCKDDNCRCGWSTEDWLNA